MNSREFCFCCNVGTLCSCITHRNPRGWTGHSSTWVILPSLAFVGVLKLGLLAFFSACLGWKPWQNCINNTPVHIVHYCSVVKYGQTCSICTFTVWKYVYLGRQILLYNVNVLNQNAHTYVKDIQCAYIHVFRLLCVYITHSHGSARVL